ncbi:esterase [Allostella vacuolata]|nr:esterase [Stella vacuolata]
MTGWRAAACLVAALALLGSGGPAGAAGTVISDLSVASPQLGRPVPYTLYLPGGPGPWPALYLLHGLGGNQDDWVGAGRLGETLDREIAAGRAAPMAVVMPMGGDSWYVDDPAGAGPVHTAFAGDLVDGIERRHPIGGCRAARAVGGLSMGGYGALLLAFRRPDRFAAAFSLSGSIFQPLADDPAAGAGRRLHMHGSVFGEPLDWRRYNRWNLFLAAPALAAQDDRPRLWLQAARDDFPAIRDGTVRLHDALSRLGVPAELRIDDGRHDWPTWARHVAPALRWLSGAVGPGCL